MEPPAALRAALERELEGRARAGLAQRTAATTAHYRAGRTSAQAIRDPDDALAYALVRLPATYAATARVFAELGDRAPGFAPRALLDAGCGPGGGSWAAQAAFGSLSAVTWLDASGPFLDLAQRLAEGAPLSTAQVQRGDLLAAILPRADLVLAAYALAEIAEAALVPLALRLWAACDGVLALVEPGTPAGHARLLAVRAALVAEGAQVLAPCPHAGHCPLAPPDWCHFSVRLPRSQAHRQAKGAEVPFEDEKFAYLLAARPGIGAAAPARVLARPRAGKPGIDLKLCTPAGLEARFAPRRDKAAHAVARRLDWGDSV